MTHPTVIQNADRTVFGLVPPKGPVAFLFTQNSATQLYEALKELRPLLEAARPERSAFPIVFGFTQEAYDSIQSSHLTVLTKAIGMAGFPATAVLADAPKAEELAEGTDLSVVEGPAGGTFANLTAYRVEAEERHLHAEQSAAVWEEAHEENSAFDAKVLAKFLADWEEAILEDLAFENHKAWLREEAMLWDQALLEDLVFEERKAELREEAVRWEEALLEDASRTRALLHAENVAWAEAIAHNERFDRANQMAAQIRQAVLDGEGMEVIEKIQQSAACLVVEPVGPDVSVPNVAQEHVSEDQSGVEPEGGVAVAAPVVQTAEAAVRTVADVQVEVRGKTRIHQNRIRSGCQVEAEEADLIVFGNLSSGAEAIAAGNVHIYGEVHGRIIAGSKGDTSAHVICQQFYGELVSIGGRYSSFENLPAEFQGAALHFWVEPDGLHYRRLDEAFNG